MKINIRATWTSVHNIDTADLDTDIDPERVDWQDINAWPEEALEQVTTAGASLTDWDVEVRD